MKQQEYTQGPEALKNFEQFGRIILQAPVEKKKEAGLRLRGTIRFTNRSAPLRMTRGLGR